MTGIRVELELEDGSFTTRMMRAGQSIADFESRVSQNIRSVNSLQSSSQSFLGTMRDVTVVLGQASAAVSFLRSVTTGWVSEIVKVNAEFEKTRKLLEGLATSGDKIKEAGDDFAYLRDQVKSAPYSLAGLTDVFVKLKSAGIDPTKGAMRGLVDAVSSFGGSEEQLKRATLAIQQMAGKGVVQMEELRQQLGEAVPRATELMARSMGVTYSQLVKLLATGTVSAKEAIAAMSGEFERTFGGAALAQMSTFNGVVTQISSTFQDLAIKVGQGGSFFQTLTDKARQLNEVLSGRGAGELADKLGVGLTKVLGAIETVVGRVAYFKHEIIDVGITLAAGFASAKALEALNALATGLSNAGNQVKALVVAWSSFGTNFQATQAALNGAGASLASFRAGLAATRAAIAATAVALIELAPVLIAVGMGVSFAISYFDLFGKKAKEAREEVEKFGASASKESLKNFVKQIQAEKDELDSLERTKKRVASVGIYVGPGSRNERLNELTAQIAEQREKIARDEQRAAQISTDYQVNEAQRAANERLRVFDQNYQDQRALFDRYGKEMADAQEAALAKAAAAGKSTDKLKEDYARAERDRQLGVYDLEIANAQSLYEELSRKSEAQQGQEKKTTDLIIDGLIKRQRAAQEARKQLEAMPLGVTLLAKPIDEDKLYQKGQAALANLQASIQGVRANLMGASGEVAELQAKLAAGKYGPIDSGRVQELIGQLVEAQAQKSKLDEMMEGRNKFDRDVTNAQIKAERDLFEARNKNISDVDKVIVGYEQGLYKGMGPTQTPMERAVQALRAQMQAATKEAGDTAQVVWGKLLGGEGAGGGDQALEKMKELARWMGSCAATPPRSRSSTSAPASTCPTPRSAGAAPSRAGPRPTLSRRTCRRPPSRSSTRSRARRAPAATTSAIRPRAARPSTATTSTRASTSRPGTVGSRRLPAATRSSPPPGTTSAWAGRASRPRTRTWPPGSSPCATTPATPAAATC